MIKFYRDKVTGEVATEKKEGSIEIIANDVDASFEKHVPYCEIKDEKIIVTVGKELHPMTEDHYIMFIARVSGSKIEKIDLKPGDKPCAEFKYVENSIIYAYCNLHSLWKKEL